MIILLFFSILSLTAISQNAEKKITIQNKNKFNSRSGNNLK